MKTIKNIALKFLVGEEAYCVVQKSTPFYQKCPTCLGEGKLFRTDKSPITCPKCNGEKKFTDSGSIIPSIDKCKIKRIHIVIDEYGAEFRYDLENKSLFFGNLYSTEEEARKNLPTYVAGYGTT